MPIERSFRRSGKQDNPGFGTGASVDDNSQEEEIEDGEANFEISLGTWYKGIWNGDSGIVRKNSEEDDNICAGYDFCLRLPDDADPSSVNVTLSIDSNNNDFYLVTYRLTNGKIGKATKVFDQINNDSIDNFCWYMGDEAEKEIIGDFEDTTGQLVEFNFSS